MRAISIVAGCLLSILAILPIAAVAQGYPNKVIRFIVPFVAGSSPDVTARLVANKLTESLGQQVIIENRSGAAGIIGAELVAKAAPDGYTFLYPVNSVICANPHLYSKLPYDPLKSFAPVTMTANFGYVLLARQGLPAADLKGLFALAKAEPGKLNFGSAGLGAGNHVAMEMLLDMAGLKMVHIPHRDSAQSIVTGDSDVSLVPYTTGVPLAQGGRVRPLAVTLARRLDALPNVPAVGELVPGYLADAWHGLFAPAGTPPAIIEKIASETARALAQPDVRKRLLDIGLEPIGSTPAAFEATIKADLEKWGLAIRAANIKLD